MNVSLILSMVLARLTPGPTDLVRLEPDTTNGSSRSRDATERLVDGDDTGEHARLGLGDCVLGLQFGAFRVEQGEKVSCTFPIPHARNRGGATALSRLLGELDEALLILAIVDERVLGLLKRGQHHLLELGYRFPRDAFHAAQPCAGASEVEGGPAQRRRHRPRACVGDVEQIAAPGQQPEEAADRDVRAARSTPSTPGRVPTSTARRCSRCTIALRSGGMLDSIAATRAPALATSCSSPSPASRRTRVSRSVSC